MDRVDARVEVRPARERDVDAIVDLLEAVAAERRWIGMEPPLDTARRRRLLIEGINDPRSVQLVATADSSAPRLADGAVVGQLGMALAPYGVADLGMVVAEAWRGRGIGGALLDAGIAWARDAGAHKVALQVWPHNQAAIALYEKFGFEREGLLRRHYRRRSGELWDAVVMGLQL
jgi:RimJ/RimL family protein N-acetyltransferase